MSVFSQYLAAIASANGLEQDIEWLFYPGMLPDSRLKWWGDFRNRPTEHEGIDICFTGTGPAGPGPFPPVQRYRLVIRRRHQSV